MTAAAVQAADAPPGLPADGDELANGFCESLIGGTGIDGQRHAVRLRHGGNVRQNDIR